MGEFSLFHWLAVGHCPRTLFR